MTLSIMMVTYNRIDLTKQTINCLVNAAKYTPTNLIIVDNGSSDGTVEYLNSLNKNIFNDIHINFEQKNKGIAIGRNIALKIAIEKYKSNWFATIDNDVIVPYGWDIECINIIQSNPEYAAIGVNMENTQYPIVVLNNKTFQKKSQGNLGTACMIFSDKIQKMLGYFNTEYNKYGMEDSDFGMRIRVLGLQLGYIKEMGKHIGEGENDVGEYREFKNKHHKENLQKFYENTRLYMAKKKSIYIPYKD